MGQGNANSHCPLGSIHYSSCVLNTRVLVNILIELVLSLDVSCIHVVRVEWALFRLAYPLVRHCHSLLFIYHVYVTVVVCNCHHSEKSYCQSQLQVISLFLSLVFHPHPTLAHFLNFVSMACTTNFQKVLIFFKGTGISYSLLLLLSPWLWITWFKLGFDIHHWSISYLGYMQVHIGTVSHL